MCDGYICADDIIIVYVIIIKAIWLEKRWALYNLDAYDRNDGAHDRYCDAYDMNCGTFDRNLGAYYMNSDALYMYIGDVDKK